ncbi:MAG TPA: single-stranded DNA-binding protein [Methylomusa anaerophila]|uniref:Single-stranded DNA-binding protein n=1 Tax=Methylomusa anaerophila TaxID=1930071 RepID=A0A348AHR7_9FIRM|nr:single-stranded DNA-binding protein [Methylomusa anaerophila]BBB90615.1 single-stranded DNA-binding protein ssb [Methylomusa anaerophila]HML88778.1 single-stranded DNA-binding protein [Methylomusa anaerophila]
MNKVILVGRLAQDPEVRYTQSGKAVASFSLAVNRPGVQGQRDADFIPIVAWEKLAEICGNNLTKGRLILVEGRLQVRSYETSDGQKRRVTEVIASNIEFLERKQAAAPGSDAGGVDINSFGKDILAAGDEEIPF